MKKKIILYVLGICFPLSNIFSQIFIPQEELKFQGLKHSKIVWIDYNSDGKKDLLICGLSYSDTKLFLYENYIDSVEEKELFAEENFLHFVLGASDFNNDGRNDFVFSTFNYMRDNFLRIYLNDTIKNDTINLYPFMYSFLNVFDIDNDGDSDIVLGNGAIESFINNGNNQFEYSIHFKNSYGDSRSKIVHGDYDCDGSIDILLYSPDESEIGFSTKLFKNTNGSLTHVKSVDFEALVNGNMIWCDINNDSFLDIILTGQDLKSNYKTNVYLNNKNGSFNLLSNSSIEGFIDCSIDKGDYDNDGDYDLLISGTTISGNNTYLYNNDGNGVFTKNSTEIFSQLGSGTVSFFDFNNDGRLDFLYSGVDLLDESVTILYKNTISIANSVPEAPNNTSVLVNDNTITFTWDIPFDSNQSGGFTYALYIYNYDLENDLLKNENNVYFQIIEMIQNNSYTVSLPNGRYKYRVCAIDASLAYGKLSEEKEFVIGEIISKNDVSEMKYSIYPRITNDYVYIEGFENEAFLVEVFSSSGTKQMIYNFANNIPLVIDFKNKKSGIYVIKITQNSVNNNYTILKK